MGNFSMCHKFVSVIVFCFICMFCLSNVNQIHAHTMDDIIKFFTTPTKTKDLLNGLSFNETKDTVIDNVFNREKHSPVDSVAEKMVYDGVVTAVGVVGKSGSAIMTTVSGTTHLPATTGLGTAYLLNKNVFNGNSEGDKAARTGTYVGAVVGTAASAGAVATYGAGTVGLATIGGFVGGGMAVGATAVVAAPVAGAIAVGYLCKWLWD